MSARVLITLTGAVLCLVGCSSAPPTDGSATGVEGVVSRDEVRDDGASERPSRPDKMLRLVLRLMDDGLEVISRTEAPNRTNRRDGRARHRTFYRVYAADGTVLEERGFEMARATRGEIREADGSIRGVRVPVDEPVFSVAVPLHEGWSEIRFFEADDVSRKDPVLLGRVTP